MARKFLNCFNRLRLSAILVIFVTPFFLSYRLADADSTSVPRAVLAGYYRKSVQLETLATTQMTRALQAATERNSSLADQEQRKANIAMEKANAVRTKIREAIQISNQKKI